MNCPYCLNLLYTDFINSTGIGSCQYCPGELSIFFTRDYRPSRLNLSIQLNNEKYDFVYQITNKILTVWKAIGGFPPDFKVVTSINYPHNSPRKIYQDVKRLINMKAFL